MSRISTDKITTSFKRHNIKTNYVRECFRGTRNEVITAEIIGLVFDTDAQAEKYLKGNLSERKKYIKVARFVVRKTSNSGTHLNTELPNERRFVFSNPEAKKEYEKNKRNYICIGEVSYSSPVLFIEDTTNRNLSHLLSPNKEGVK